MDPTAAPVAPREGSPITNRLTTTSNTNYTTDDTLALFPRVIPTLSKYHSTTVSPEHVIQLLWRPHTPDLFLSISYYPHNYIHPYLVFTPVSLAEQRRNKYTSKMHRAEIATVPYNNTALRSIPTFPPIIMRCPLNFSANLHTRAVSLSSAILCEPPLNKLVAYNATIVIFNILTTHHAFQFKLSMRTNKKQKDVIINLFQPRYH